VLTRITRYAPATMLVLWLSGCDVSGGEGQPCENRGSMMHPKYVCDTGFVCNYGYEGTPKGPVCERPGVNGVGNTCGTDVNCATGLWCNIYKCETLLGIGEICAYYAGCAPGLICSNDETAATPRCVPAGAIGEPCRVDSSCDAPLTCNANPAYGLPVCVGSDASADADAGP
jgi:hypothetical protein